jgi:rod shape-determining protein MreD
MIWRRTLLLALLTVTGLALETTIFGSATLTGTKPELLLLVTVALAMGEGPMLGATAGFATGLATDLVLDLPQGLTALTFTVVGYGVGRIRAQVQVPSAWLPMAMVLVSTFFGVAFYGGLSFVLGEESVSALRALRYAGLAAAYNALLTPFVFPLVRALGARLRPARGTAMTGMVRR